MSPQQQAAAETMRFLNKVNTIILYPLIAGLVGLAFLIFIYGCAEYILNADNESARAEGKKHIFFGVIGLVVIVSAYGIITIAVNTFGLKGQLDCARNPALPNCSQMFRVR